MRATQLFLCLLTSLLFFSHVQAEEVEAAASEREPRKLSIIEIYSLSNILPRDYIDLQNDLAAMKGVDELQQELPQFHKDLKEMKWEVTISESTPDVSYHQLALLKSKLVKLKIRLDEFNTPIASNISNIQRLYIDWLDKDKTFTEIKQHHQAEEETADFLATVAVVEKTINDAKKMIELQLVPNLDAGKKIGQTQTQIYGLAEKVDELIKDTNELRIQQTSPSMLSAEFYQRLDVRQFKQSGDNFRLFCLYQWGYLKQNLGWVLVAFGSVALLAFFIQLSRSKTSASSRWHDYASHPLLSAIFISSVVFSLVNALSIRLALPPDWNTLLQIPLILSVAFMTEKIVALKWQAVFLRRLTIFLAVTALLTVMNIPHSIFYLFVFYVSAIVFCVSLYSFIERWKAQSKKKVTWAIWLWGLFPIVILITGIGGYDQLAILLFGRVLVLVFVTLVILVMMQIISGLLELGLLFFPMNIVRNNAPTIVRQLVPMIAIAHGVLWLAIALMAMWVYPTLREAFGAVTSLEFQVSTFNITPGSLLVVVFVCYITLLFSRGLRAFLMQEVLPRYRVEKGAQVSITRLVHYAVLTIGLLVLLRILGFSLSQITILGGALSVGIGFGLQAIVNNFVSGLILLFERPIKVGDMIEVNDDIGEVKELGLRATTVQTFDNAEIVIPNSQLITGSVINWTLAEKRARVKVPVGVAYGSDIAEVLKILLACANANPRVLSTPKPSALFLSFGASSLDFELRAWIPDVNYRLDILSELNQDIESEFQVEGIEIPFPQTDLHVRSVDSAVTGGFLKVAGASEV